MRDQYRVTRGYVTLRMTHKQLGALFHALGNNSVDFPDAMEALFPDGRSRRRGYEAAEIVGRAFAAVHRRAEGDRHAQQEQ